ncbi:MAG: hypothetical protein FJ253_06250 [Phycisphaerae bacterium]|nr:hypothetical protein [Phycisphaerae bacterium]
MSKRGATPVLYELLGAASTSGSAGPRAAPGAAESGHASARRTVRVPIGWFWLFAVGTLVLLAVAYQFGRSSGERAGFARGQEFSSDRALQARVTGDTPDPGGGAGATGAGGAGAALGTNGGAPSVSPISGGPGNAAGASNPASSGAATADPRERGRNYLVIARPATADAPKLVDFLRSHQLDAAIVPDDNPRFRKVVALPGFPAGTARSSEQVRRLESKVKSLGQQWKTAARGNRDFDDAYLELHR